jgi:hypothetical protein
MSRLHGISCLVAGRIYFLGEDALWVGGEPDERILTEASLSDREELAIFFGSAILPASPGKSEAKRRSSYVDGRIQRFPSATRRPS